MPRHVQLGAALTVLLVLYGMQLTSLETSERVASADASVAAIGLPAYYAAEPDGEQLYNQMCSSCHGAEGQGTPGIFPPLVDTDWVTGPKGRVIRIVLHGLEGAIEVDGKTYSRPMPSWGGNLDDEEMAAVINHIRTSWGNEADTVAAEEVASVRAATEGRRDAWTPEDFEEEENLEIPNEEAVE